MTKFFTKIKDYFTANVCRKIFFMAAVIGVLLYIGSFAFGEMMLQTFGTICLLIAMIMSMVDTMIVRRHFLLKVKEMQYAHLDKINQMQQAGQSVEITSTFSPQEKRFLRRKRFGFLAVILLKLGLVLALISLLLA